MDSKNVTPRPDHAASLAIFLLEKTGSVFGQWRGHMLAADQRALFGRFLGKGSITIDGTEERIGHSVKRCFGLDYEVTFDAHWRDL